MIDEDPEHGPSLLRDYLMASPAVVGYVAGEVERRAAEGTRFDHQLAVLQGIAKSGRERAAVTLLAARAAEGTGDSDTAERLAHEALTAQPDLPAALLDAGEYAACRGDARAADGYLRRSGHPPAEALRGALKRQLAPPKTTASRNQPCSCGSGRKYKMCCLAKATRPLTDRAEVVYALLAAYAQRAASAETLSRLAMRSGGNRQSTLLCLDLLLTDCGLTERFLRTRSGWLRDDERELAESWQHIPIGLFEAREIQRGVGLTVRPLPGGEPVFRTGCSPRPRAVWICSAAGSCTTARSRATLKGNRQKVGLVLAFMSLPELLVLDEPTSGLDPLMRSEFERLVREVVAAGRTVFWSSHELDEVQRLADRVAIIKRGRLIATETVEGLRESAPQTLHARFAGPVDPSLFARIDGLSVTSCDGDAVQLEVTGAIGPVLRVIADHDPVDFTRQHADLDELFVAFYRESAAPESSHAH